jgi:hypothetical protein
MHRAHAYKIETRMMGREEDSKGVLSLRLVIRTGKEWRAFQLPTSCPVYG